MSDIHAPRSFDPGLTDPVTTVVTMPSNAKSTALKVVSGAGLVALSCWLTLLTMEYFQSQWELVRANTIR